jgi:phospholipid/cholesterol/gamma-HCH transport system permease protein
MGSEGASAGTAGRFSIERQSAGTVLRASGRWDVAAAAALDRALARWRPTRGEAVRMDLSALERLDTAGAWLLHRTLKGADTAGATVELIGLQPAQAVLLEQVAANDRPVRIEPDKAHGLRRIVERTGKSAIYLVVKARNFTAFLGLIVVTLARIALQPRRLRFTSLVYHMEATGFSALPIVGLLSFLIGVVLAYQGAEQLQRFGAEVFVVNLIAVSVLREIGVLMTAIVVAGRSGSAFTAQIGAMKVSQEIDAIRTLGLDPVEVLVAPRLLALMVVLPLLSFYAAIMGLLGGAVMAWVVLGITPEAFVQRLYEAAGFWTVMTGLIKAPFFAFAIALIGCYEGLRVEGSAESVGKLTTRAVVESIFLVIVLDALFSILFNMIGI